MGRLSMGLGRPTHGMALPDGTDDLDGIEGEARVATAPEGRARFGASLG